MPCTCLLPLIRRPPPPTTLVGQPQALASFGSLPAVQFFLDDASVDLLVVHRVDGVRASELWGLLLLPPPLLQLLLLLPQPLLLLLPLLFFLPL